MDENERIKLENEYHKAAVEAYVTAQDELSKSVPFISKDICEEYKVILQLCNLQLLDFEERWNVSNLGTEESKRSLKSESYKRTGEINAKYNELNERIRDYLNKLDVL